MSELMASQGEINFIVKEYLEYSNFRKTANIFEMECSEHNIPIANEMASNNITKKYNELMSSYAKGNVVQFFELWNKNIGNKEGKDFMKLQLDLHVYFAIHTLKNNESLAAHNGMEKLKTFLASNGSSLSQQTDCLSYFALPYIPDLKTHTSYQHLFSNNWSDTLQHQLENFLKKMLPSSSVPKLIKLCKLNIHDGQINRNLDQKPDKNFGKLLKDYNNLIQITANLIEAIESAIHGKPISQEYIKEISQKLFTDDVRSTTDFMRPGTASKTLRDSIAFMQENNQQTQKNINDNREATSLEHVDPMGLQNLNYNKIKHELISGDDKQRCLLIQALTWRITKTSSSASRLKILHDYVIHDVLGCTKDSNIKKSLTVILQSRNETLKHILVKFLNVIASWDDGRDYLSRDEVLVESLIASLQSNAATNNQIKEHLLGCLQKLSLRRAMQTLMIKDGMMRWLVDELLKGMHLMSSYMVEYAVALLMNLSLRTEGKFQCVPMCTEILTVLTNLYTSDYSELMSYLNGMLFSIISVKDIRNKALSFGMLETLEKVHSSVDMVMGKQVEHIIKRLTSTEYEDEDSEVEENDEDDEEDNDSMMEGFDDGDTLIKLKPGEKCGDQMLIERYSNNLGTNSAIKASILRRPMTPAQKVKQNYSLANQGTKRLEAILPEQPQVQKQKPQPEQQQAHHQQRPPTRSGSRPISAKNMDNDSMVKSGMDNHNMNESEKNPFKSQPKLPRTSESRNL